MKHTLSILIILSSHIVFSQDLQFTINYLDSIYNMERTYFETANGYNEKFALGRGYNKIIYLDSIPPFDTRNIYIDRKYEKQVLNYVENFMYDSLPNIRRITYDFIYSLGFYSKKKKIRQRSVNMLLEMIFSPYVDRSVLVGLVLMQKTLTKKPGKD